VRWFADTYFISLMQKHLPYRGERTLLIARCNHGIALRLRFMFLLKLLIFLHFEGDMRIQTRLILQSAIALKTHLEETSSAGDDRRLIAKRFPSYS